MHALLLVGGTAVAAIFLTMVGMGGGTIYGPVLVLLGVEPSSAFAGSLVLVAATSMGGVIGYSTRGIIKWKTALVFGVAAMLTSYAAGLVCSSIPRQYLLPVSAVAFLVLGTSVHVTLMSGSRQVPTFVAGAGAGILTGFLGVGGGVVAMPYFLKYHSMDPEKAAATTSVVVLMASLTGVMGHLSGSDHIPSQVPYLLAGVLVGGLAGPLVGRKVSGRIRLWIFSFLLYVAALSMLWRWWSTAGR